jgi:hypothetical protein
LQRDKSTEGGEAGVESSLEESTEEIGETQKPQNISSPTIIVGSIGAGQPIGKEERKKCCWRKKFGLLGILREK